MSNKKKAAKIFKKIADKLQPVTFVTTEKHHVIGAVLLAQGHFEVNGEPINPIKIYTEDMPVVLQVNHKRRLKKFYKKNGIAGMHSYIKAVQNLKETQV